MMGLSGIIPYIFHRVYWLRSVDVFRSVSPGAVVRSCQRWRDPDPDRTGSTGRCVALLLDSSPDGRTGRTIEQIHSRRFNWWRRDAHLSEASE